MDKPDFPQWTLRGFVEQLAEGSPLPGGGCAVALAGALAAALGALSARIMAKRPPDGTAKRSLEDLVARITLHQETFLEQIDADALAYHGVVEARQLPRRNPGETAHRERQIAAAFLKACEPPEQMARQGLDLLGWALDLGRGRNPVVLADIGVMGYLAGAVVQGALINIYANLGMAGDFDDVAARWTAARELEARWREVRGEFEALMAELCNR